MDEVDLTNSTSYGALKAATGYTSISLHEPVKLRLGKQGAAALPSESVPQFFRKCCKKFDKLPALVYETPGEGTDCWTTVTYSEYEQKVQQAALILLHVGLQPRSSVGILAVNCPEWFYVELGAILAGGIIAGIYSSNSAEAVFHVLDTSEATVCLVDDAQQMAKVRAVKSRLPRLHAVVQLHEPFDSFVGNEEGYYRWEDLVKLQFNKNLLEELELRERNVAPNESAMLIYTSGTVGMPKAVMHSHDAVVFEAKSVASMLKDIEIGAEVTVTYLPLSHIAAQIFDIFSTLVYGGCVYFADRNALKGTLTTTCLKAKPTRMFGVPRIYEKFQEKLLTLETVSTPFTRFLLNKSRQFLQRYYFDRITGKATSRCKYWLASRTTQNLKIALGLERCKTFFVGGAPVTDQLKQYFMSIDMPLTDVYGLSETGGAVTVNMELSSLESVGKALDGFELKIFNPDSNGHGEICIRGRGILMGYLNDYEKTKEILKEDGWLHSGDLGYLDTESNLVISGRIKELIITAGGENIPPIHVEQLIKTELPCISNAVLVGDHRKYLTVLLTLKTESDPNTGLPSDELRAETINWLQTLGLNFTHLSQVLNIPADLKQLDASNVKVKTHTEVQKAIEEGIMRANQNAISNAQKVQKFSLLPHDFSINTGELGSTLKIKRNIVLQKYATVIEQMYA